MEMLRNLLNRKMSRRGFTLVELMMVITVIALVAGLATSAAVHSVKQSRKKRIQTTCTALQISIMNYRAKENEWPWADHLAAALATQGKTDETASQIIFSGKNNKYVFENMIKETVKGTPYLDTSAIMVDKVANRTNNSKTSRLLRDVIASGISSGLALGYPDVDNPSIFHYFKVIYNIPTDSVSVTTE